MSQKEYILQELRELKSTLAGYIALNPYTVPNGYFEGLTEQIMRRIKALDAATAKDELNQLSVLLAGLSKQMPYEVPAGYFEGLAAQVLRRIKAMEAASVQDELQELSPLLAGLSKKMPFEVPAGYFDNSFSAGTAPAEESAAEELSMVSPLLSGMKKDMPYEVPAGYFDNLAAGILQKVVKKEAKVVSFTSRSWFRYAAAAVVVGIVATVTILVMNRGTVSANENSYAWVKQNVKKVSTEKLDEFVQLTDADKAMAAADTKGKEVKDLVKDVPESEIQSLLNDTEGLDDNSSEGDASTEASLN